MIMTPTDTDLSTPAIRPTLIMVKLDGHQEHIVTL